MTICLYLYLYVQIYFNLHSYLYLREGERERKRYVERDTHYKGTCIYKLLDIQRKSERDGEHDKGMAIYPHIHPSFLSI